MDMKKRIADVVRRKAEEGWCAMNQITITPPSPELLKVLEWGPLEDDDGDRHLSWVPSTHKYDGFWCWPYLGDWMTGDTTAYAVEETILGHLVKLADAEHIIATHLPDVCGGWIVGRATGALDDLILTAHRFDDACDAVPLVFDSRLTALVHALLAIKEERGE